MGQNAWAKKQDYLVKMFKKLALVVALLIFTYCELVNLASILPHRIHQQRQPTGSLDNNKPSGTQIDIPFTTQAPTGLNLSVTQAPDPSATTSSAPPSQASTGTPTTTADSNLEPDDLPSASTVPVPPADARPPAPPLPPQTPADPNDRFPRPPALPPTLNNNVPIANKTKPAPDQLAKGGENNNNIDWSILFYSIFIVYVSLVKLIYHNVHWIRHNMTEPGILMLFGIIWELLARQISSNYDAHPRFNPRIFFYLFLPSTVLESSSLLSNKWLLSNLFPVLTHSMLGTILYALLFGFTIHSIGKTQFFVIDPAADEPGPGPSLDARPLASPSMSLEYHNATITDCFILGTILASIDATPMLNVFKHLQVNEKLYFLVLGENVMNNAVVIVLFNLLLDNFETTKLTVFKAYMAVLHFFVMILGGLLIGLVLAAFAFVCVRLTRRFQVPDMLSSYQSQCQAMVETLLILKVAYLTYTLANLAGTSSIVSLATFGILNEQYIKQNLNLSSQVTFKQVILATKTIGLSLVYPLLGMLLVEVASSGRFYQQADVLDGNSSRLASPSSRNLASSSPNSPALASSFAAADKLAGLAQQAFHSWNFKLLSVVTILTIVYRLLIVLALGLISNLLTCGQLKIKFRELILLAYGGLKGPLAIALVHRLLDHENHRHRLVYSRHLFTYTVLTITFVSTVLIGSFTRPLVSRMQSALVATARASPSSSTHLSLSPSPSPAGVVARPLAAATELAGDKTTNYFDSNKQTANAEQESPEAAALFEQINRSLAEHASQALDCILGHPRSSPEKFFQTDELCKSLELDKHGGANCLQVRSGNFEGLRTPRGAIQRTERTSTFQTNKNALGEQSALASQLDVSPRGHAPVVMRAPKTSEGRISQILAKLSSENLVKSEQTLLREFVMLNLKLERSRQQYRSQVQRARRSHKDTQLPSSIAREIEVGNKRLLSSTTSSVGPPNSDERASKQQHLLRLARENDSPTATGRRRMEPKRSSRERARRRQRRRRLMSAKRDQSDGGISQSTSFSHHRIHPEQAPL